MENPYGVTASPGDVQRGPLSLPFTLSGCLNEEEARSICIPKPNRLQMITPVLIAIALLTAMLLRSGSLQRISGRIAAAPLSGMSLQMYAVAAIPLIFWAFTLYRQFAFPNQLQPLVDSLQNGKTLRFTEDGIELATPEASGRWRWDAVRSSEKREPVGVILFNQTGIAGELHIAKRWFAGESEWNQFWDLLAHKTDPQPPAGA